MESDIKTLKDLYEEPESLDNSDDLDRRPSNFASDIGKQYNNLISGNELKVYAALLDLGDNPLDNDAKEVRFLFFRQTSKTAERIEIIDDGSGMTRDKLEEVQSYANASQHALNSGDLGKYGCGLAQSSIALGFQREIFSRAEGSDEILVSTTDWRPSIEGERPKGETRKATPAEKDYFNKRLSGSGTIVRIFDLRKRDWSSMKPMVDNFIPLIGEVYREYISKGNVKFFVSLIGPNGKVQVPQVGEAKLIKSVDPLRRKEVEMVLDISKTVVFEGHTIGVRGVMFKENEAKTSYETQGIYVSRADRQICRGAELGGLYKKHNKRNRVRIELLFPEALDSWTNPNIQKTEFTLDLSLSQKLTKEFFAGFQSKVAEQIKLETKNRNSRPSPSVIESVEKDISKNMKWIPTMTKNSEGIFPVINFESISDENNDKVCYGKFDDDLKWAGVLNMAHDWMFNNYLPADPESKKPILELLGAMILQTSSLTGSQKKAVDAYLANVWATLKNIS